MKKPRHVVTAHNNKRPAIVRALSVIMGFYGCLGMAIIDMGCFDILLHGIKYDAAMVHYVRVYVSLRTWLFILWYYCMVYVLIL